VIVGVTTRALATAAGRRAAVVGLAVADLTVGLRDVYKPLVTLALHLEMHEDRTHDQADHQNAGEWK
jgi:hypothetical protein